MALRLRLTGAGVGVGITGMLILMIDPVWAHHHHRHDLPPPSQPEPDYTLNPKQTKTDAVRVPASVVKAENAANAGNDAPALLLPDHYRHPKKGKLNGNSGWVGSKRPRGKHDIGLNAPVPQTGDPSGSKTRNVFRRGMPVYEPNY